MFITYGIPSFDWLRRSIFRCIERLARSFSQIVKACTCHQLSFYFPIRKWCKMVLHVSYVSLACSILFASLAWLISCAYLSGLFYCLSGPFYFLCLLCSVYFICLSCLIYCTCLSGPVYFSCLLCLFSVLLYRLLLSSYFLLM